MTEMRALVLTKYGPPEVLEVQERPKPSPKRGEVLIEVHAAGVNFADLQARLGFYPDAPKPPSVLGYEVAGVVVEVGAGVDASLLGRRAMAPTRFGGFAEYAVASAVDLMGIPEAMTFVEAAAVPVVYATAYESILKQANVEEGETVLIHSAAGGVGLAAVQLARHRGATVIGTASASKHEALRGHGAHHTIDYRSEDVTARVREITDGKGVDVILDSRGGAAFRESYDLLRAGGRLVMYGVNTVSSGSSRDFVAVAKMWLGTPRFKTLDLLDVSKTLVGTNLLRLWDQNGDLERIARPIARLLREGVVKPVVGATFALEDAPLAHHFIHDRKNVGKVVLTVQS
jgi:NADPH:quinone reductase-like Zn-dependent oxidoreductase